VVVLSELHRARVEPIEFAFGIDDEAVEARSDVADDAGHGCSPVRCFRFDVPNGRNTTLGECAGYDAALPRPRRGVAMRRGRRLRWLPSDCTSNVSIPRTRSLSFLNPYVRGSKSGARLASWLPIVPSGTQPPSLSISARM